MTKNFSQVELNFLKSKGINIENLKTRWAWVNENLAVEFYRDFLIPYFKKVPTNNELDAHGFRGFRYTVGRIRKKMTEITKAAGYKPHFEVKYKDMSFEDLVELYLYKIYPELKEKLKLSEKQPLTKTQLEKNEYRGFVEAIYKRGRSISDLQRAAGFKPLKEHKYAGKSFEALVEMFLSEIYPDLQKKYNLKDDEHPKREQIKKTGYSGFLGALRRIGKTYNNLVKAAGFMPRMEHKYVEKSFEELVEMFKNEIYPALVKKLSLQMSIAPTRDQVEKYFRGFTNALTNMNRYFAEVVRSIGMEPIKEQRFRDLNTIEDMAEYYINEIYPYIKMELEKQGFILAENEAPTAPQLREFGYAQFVAKIYQIASYNDLVMFVGLKPNIEYKYVDMSFDDLVKFFKEEIYPDIKIRADLNRYMAPSKEEMTKIGYSGLFDAIYRTGNTYNDLVRKAGLIPRQTIESEVGTLTHKAINYLLSEINLSDNLLPFIYYGEVMIFHPITQSKIDGIIVNNNNLKNHLLYSFKNWVINSIANSDEEQMILKLILNLNSKNFILIDYSSALLNFIGEFNDRNITDKILKYRKNNDSILILVDTKWPSIPNSCIVKLPEYFKQGIKKISIHNTVLISPKLFSELIGLKGQRLERFKEIISYNRNNNLIQLKSIISDYKNREIKTSSTTQLTEFLKRTNNRSIKIKKNLTEKFNPYIDPTTLDKWIYKD